MKPELTISNALNLLNSNKSQAAREVLDNILNQTPDNLHAHQLLVKYAFKSKNYALAEKHLLSLLKLQPTVDNYINSLVELYTFQKRWQDIANLYLNIALIQANNSTIHFNCAYYLKLAGKFEQAITHYNKTLALGISQDYEVSLNLAIIYSEHLGEPNKAIDILLKANSKYPDNDAILYNLANVYEQLGNKEKALSYFQLAFTKNPKNYNALARQADISHISSPNNSLIVKMNSALELSTNISDKINIAYALGKSYNDCNEYKLAFEFYQQANELDKQTLPVYNAKSCESYINSIIDTFNKAWFDNFESPSLDIYNLPPLFICGMFRSGSTLCEQILAGHSQVSIGGEQEFFHRTIANSYAQYPENISQYLNKDKNKLLRAYKAEIMKQQKNGLQLTDKRPDNFLYLGLIKALMPNAKVIWTKRALLDNCLSIYFLRLGASMSYATDIKNIMHFYKQQEKLMEHWKTLFGDSIYEFDYDSLIESPETNIKALLSFSKLPWEQSCLDFHQVENQVKTASVWQVRQPLYKSSSGRCCNYQEFLST